MSDRVAVMNRGVIEQVGTPEDIYQRPASRFVASFVGESNEITGTVVSIHHDGRATVRTDRGLEVAGTAVDGLRVGSPAVAAIRPERIDIIAGSRLESEHGPALPVVCENAVYMGNRHRYEFVTPQGQRFIVYRSVQEGGLDPAAFRGESVLSWQARHMRVYAIDEAGGAAQRRAP